MKRHRYWGRQGCGGYFTGHDQIGRFNKSSNGSVRKRKIKDGYDTPDVSGVSGDVYTRLQLPEEGLTSWYAGGYEQVEQVLSLPPFSSLVFCGLWEREKVCGGGIKYHTKHYRQAERKWSSSLQMFTGPTGDAQRTTSVLSLACPLIVPLFDIKVGGSYEQATLYGFPRLNCMLLESCNCFSFSFSKKFMTYVFLDWANMLT